MILFRVLASLVFYKTLGQEQDYLKCKENITSQLTNYYYPAIQLENEYIIKEKLNQFQMILMQELDMFYKNVEPHFWFLSEAQLILVYYEASKQNFSFITNSIVFDIEDDIFQSLEFIPKEKLFLNLPNCFKIIEIFKDGLDWKIICQNQNFFEIYFCLNKIEAQEQNMFQILSNQNITIQNNCIFKTLYQKNFHYLFFSELNCSNWKLYIVKENDVQSVLEANQFNNQHLQNIIDIENEIYLIFSNQVFRLFLQSSIQQISKEIQLIYENEDPNIIIIDYQMSSQMQNIIILQLKNSSSARNNTIIGFNQTDYSILITMNDKPKKIMYLNENLIFLMEPNKTEYTTQNLNQNIFFIEADFLDTWPKMNSFYFGLNKNYFLIYKQNYYSPIINCNDYKNQQNIILKQKQLFNDRQIMNLKLHYFNNESEMNNLYLNQKLLVLNIDDNKFNFFLTKEYFLNGTLPKLKFEVNDQIFCEQSEKQVILQNINIKQSTKLWSIVILNKDYLFLVFQTIDLSVYLCELESNKLIYIRKFEALLKNNIYYFQPYLLIANNNNQQLFILSLEKYPNINSYIFEFPEKIVSIQFLNRVFSIILHDCEIIRLNIFSQQKIYKNIIKNKTRKNFCQNNSQALDLVIFQFFKNKIIEIHEQFTVSTNFKQGEIIKSFPIGSRNFIMLIEQFNQLNFYKYFYFNYKFIQLFQLPLYNFEIVQPIQHQENGQYLILLASSNIKQKYYSLLIYALKKDFHEILYDIIEDIDNQFYLISDNTILYYKQNISYIYEIGKLSVSCELKQTYFHKKQVNLSVILISHIFSGLTQNSSLNLIVQNKIRKLNLKVPNKIYLQNKITGLNLDIRQLVIGYVSSIKSKDFIIQFPIQKINNISKELCPKFEKNLCINYEKNYIITNLSEQTKINLPIIQGQQIFFESQFIIVQDLINSNIIIYKKNSQQICELKINQIVPIEDLFIINNLLFLIYSDLIFVYDLQKVELVQTIMIQCQECKKVLIENNNELILIFSKILKNRNVYIIQSNQENYVQIHELTIKNFPLHQYDFSSMEILDIVEFDTYLKAKVLIYSPIENLQILNATISKSFNEVELTEYQVILRLWLHNTLINLQILTKDLLFTIDDNQTFRLYNISEYYNYEFIDPIFQISFQDKKVEKINESHLIIISQMNEPHEIYQIQPYFLEFKNNEMMKNTFIIYNNVSEIEFEIFKYQEYNSKFYYWFVLVIILICFLVFYMFRRLRLIRKKNQQYQNSNF